MKTITIVSSREQKKYVIETEASTMAELTAAMDEAGINYSGMTLYEGLTKAEYNPTKGDAILPHDVPYKGTVTNDLVFMLTAPQKKIKSGGMSYSEMKAYIKDNGLADKFAAQYGKNYTQGKTSEFEAFIAKNTAAPTHKEEVPATPAESKTIPNPECKECKDSKLRNAFCTLLDKLYDEGTLYSEDVDELKDMLDDTTTEEVEEPEDNGKKSPFSKDEIDAMFADM